VTEEGYRRFKKVEGKRGCLSPLRLSVEWDVQGADALCLQRLYRQLLEESNGGSVHPRDDIAGGNE